MPTYNYTAMNASGQDVRGFVDGDSHDDVIAKLKAGGLFPTKVKEQYSTHPTVDRLADQVINQVEPEVALNPMSFRPDGTMRTRDVTRVLHHFSYSHLPPHLQEVSKPCYELAIKMADALLDSPELVYGLRELLAAKDNFVRAKLE